MVLELLRRTLDRSLDALSGIPPEDTRYKVDTRVVSALEEIFRTHVLPSAPEHPSVLIVGIGARVEEVLAVNQVFTPSSIIALEPENLGKISVPKWRRYLQQAIPLERRDLVHRISLYPYEFEAIEGPFDIVMAMSIGIVNQNPKKLSQLANRSQGLTVFSAYKNSRYKFGPLNEYEHIDAQIKTLTDWTPLVSMPPLDGPTTDGHLWVLKRKADRERGTITSESSYTRLSTTMSLG